MKAGDTVSYIICQVKMSLFIAKYSIQFAETTRKTNSWEKKVLMFLCSEITLEFKMVSFLY